MSIKINFKKKTPKYLGQFFTDKNEKEKNLKYYFFIENRILKPMNSCERFTYAYLNGLNMYVEIIGWAPLCENSVILEFENVSSEEVAKYLLEQEWGNTFFAITEEGVSTNLLEFEDFISAISNGSTFVKFKK